MKEPRKLQLKFQGRYWALAKSWQFHCFDFGCSITGQLAFTAINIVSKSFLWKEWFQVQASSHNHC